MSNYRMNRSSSPMTRGAEMLVPKISPPSSLKIELVYWIMCGDRVPECGCGL